MAAAVSLEGVVNLTPHDIVVYEHDRKTVRHTFKTGGPSLRLLEDTKRKTAWLKAAPGIKVPCNIGGAAYSGLSKDPPDAAVIVSDLVARYLVETDFKHPIFTPDTNPASAVRDNDGKIIGVLQLTWINP